MILKYEISYIYCKFKQASQRSIDRNTLIKLKQKASQMTCFCYDGNIKITSFLPNDKIILKIKT